MPGGAEDGERTIIAPLSPLGSGKALVRAGGYFCPLRGALGPGPSSQVSALSREHAPTCWGCRQRPGRGTGKGTAGTKRPHGARRERGEEHHQTQRKHMPVAKSLHSQDRSPCAERWALPTEKRKAPRSPCSYSGCLPGPRAPPKRGLEGRAAGGREKGKKMSEDAGPAESRKRDGAAIILLLPRAQGRTKRKRQTGRGGWGRGTGPALGGAAEPKTSRPGPGHLCSISNQSKTCPEWLLHARLRWPTPPLISKPRVDAGPAPQSPHTTPLPAPRLKPPLTPGRPAPAASPLALHLLRPCLSSEREDEQEGCPHPDPCLWPLQRSQSHHLALGTLLLAGDPVGPSASLRPSGALLHSLSVQTQEHPSPLLPAIPGPCPRQPPVPRQSLGSGPASAVQPPSLPRAPADASATAWPGLALPSWPECSRCSCRSHPNTRSFELPFFFPFCRDFMAGAAGSGPASDP